MQWNLEEALSYYKTLGAPEDQNVLISLLREIQQESGGSIPGFAVTEAAAFYGIKDSLLLALVHRVPSLRLGDTHVLELCVRALTAARQPLWQLVLRNFASIPAAKCSFASGAVCVCAAKGPTCASMANSTTPQPKIS